jgi:hypothetical protein
MGMFIPPRKQMTIVFEHEREAEKSWNTLPKTTEVFDDPVQSINQKDIMSNNIPRRDQPRPRSESCPQMT